MAPERGKSDGKLVPLGGISQSRLVVPGELGVATLGGALNKHTQCHALHFPPPEPVCPRSSPAQKMAQ